MSNNINIILHIFKCLSDTSFQKKSWIQGRQFDDYCSSLSESVNSLDDFNFFDDVHDRKFNFTESFYLELDNYLNEIVNYEEKINNIEDKEWLKLTLKANEIYNKLKNKSVW